jgi:hypothetical protein
MFEIIKMNIKSLLLLNYIASILALKKKEKVPVI